MNRRLTNILAFSFVVACCATADAGFLSVSGTEISSMKPAKKVPTPVQPPEPPADFRSLDSEQGMASTSSVNTSTTTTMSHSGVCVTADLPKLQNSGLLLPPESAQLPFCWHELDTPPPQA